MVAPISLPKFAEVECPGTSRLWVLHLAAPVFLAEVIEDRDGSFTGLEHVKGWGDELRPEHNPARLLREAGEWYLNILDSND